MKIDNLNDVVQHLKAQLPKYLEKHGINSAKRFVCINTAHNENTPSAALNPKTNYTQGHCFGCGMSFDIFNAAHWLEGLPAEGAAWITETIPALATQLGVNIQYVEPSEDEKERLGVYRVYAETAAYVSAEKTGKWTKDVENYISENKWDKQFLSAAGVGVCDEDEYIQHMISKGYSIDYLVEVRLIPPRGISLHHTPSIIATDQLVFTITDELGRPCAFAARRFSGDRKFVNTGSTGTNDIYQKGKRLYNLDLAKRSTRLGKPLHIVEGYGDVLSARMRSIENIVATCGTALTVEQLMLLSKMGVNDIILLFDFDDAGQKNSQRVIETVLPKVSDMRCRVAIAKEEDSGKDPGQLLLEQGSEGILSLKTVPAFNWLLERYRTEGLDPTDIATRLVPVIASEPNAIVRDSQINALVKASGVEKYAIEIQVRKQTEEVVAERERKRQRLLTQFKSALDDEPASSVQLCEEFMLKFEDLETEYEVDRYSPTSSLHMTERQRSREENKEASDIHGFRLPFMQDFESHLSGGRDWSSKTLMMVGGEENVGKTSWIRWFLYNIACVEENNAVCIYWSIDDSEEEILPGFVALANVELSGFVPTLPQHPVLDINHIVNPKRSVLGLSQGEQEAIWARRSKAYDRVLDLMRNERLIIKDAKSGNSLSYAKGVVRHYRRKYPDKKIVIVIDNTHNLSDGSELKEIRDRFTRIANTMKNGIVNKYDCLAIASVEYRKKSNSTEAMEIQMPNNDRIAEARAFKYRAQWIGHLYSDISERPTKYTVFWEDPITGEHRPRVIMLHSKTKINKWKGAQYMDFHSECSAFTEVGSGHAKVEHEKYFEKKKQEDKQ